MAANDLAPPAVEQFLDQMLAMLISLGAGEVGVRMPTTGGTERMMALALGLNMLAEDVEARQADLESLVKQRTQALAEARLELERSNAELEQFAYVASHDLQEPLRMISSYVQLLASRYQGRLDADADEFIFYAVDGAKRMQALISDLLTYARVGSRGRPPARVPLEAVVARVLLNLEVRIAESGARVVHQDLPEVQGDASQLLQLFQNLIGNALKFHGPAPPLVEILARRDGAFWELAVEDNGIGIEPQYADRIFTVFQRLHTRAEYEGTGIGLAVCKKIVERHGGRIWIEPASHRGTRFCFTLPEAVANSDG